MTQIKVNFIYFAEEDSVSEGGSSDEDGVEPGLKIFKCEECHKTFKDKKYLKQHVIIHKKDKPFKCFHCPKLFKALKYLNQCLRGLVNGYGRGRGYSLDC